MDDRALHRLMAVLIVGILPAVLDSTIVNVALGTVGRDLHTSVANVQWIITAYLLALAVAIPVTGWAVARFGGKRMWLAALALFLAGSMLCGISPDFALLIVFRAVQGIGAGLLIPIMQTLLVQAAHGRPLGRLIAMVSMPALVGPILGPVVGGLIVGNTSWRWIFYVNAPVCLVALVLAWRAMPDDRDNTSPYRMDGVGLALLCPALAAAILALSQVGIHGGFDHPQVIVPLVLSAFLFVAFVLHSLRTNAVPVVDLRLFGSRSFSAASVLLFLSGLCLYGAMLLLPLYYQQVRGARVVTAGLLLAPQGIGSLLTRGWLGHLTDRLGARPVILGCLVATLVGTLPFAITGAHTNEWLLAIPLMVRGAGLGGVTFAVTTAAMQGLDRSQVPHASSATRIAQQIGGSFGAAILAVILQHQIQHAASPVTAFNHAFWWATGFTAAAFVPALLLPSRNRPSDDVAPRSAEQRAWVEGHPNPGNAS